MTQDTIFMVRNANKNDFGGGERYPVYLSVELKSHNYTPIVYSHHRKIIDLCKERGVNSHKMPWLTLQNYSGLGNIFLPFYFIWLAYLIIWYLINIEKTGATTIHLQSRDDFIAGTIAGKILKKRVVWTDHADLKYIYQNTSKPFKNTIGKIVRLVSRYVYKIMIVSKSELKLIEQSLGHKAPQNYVVIYNGIRNQSVKSHRDYDKKTYLFVATSRLVRSKGIYELIDATKKLVKNNYHVKCLLLGEGHEKDAMLRHSDDSIVFMGFPSNYLDIVKGADFFIHPSYNEGFSLSILEAAMLGMPVIATRVGGNTEIIENNVTGLLVKPNSAEALYDAMEYAINNKKVMNEMGVKLRKKYLDGFQFNNIVSDKIIPIYRGMM